MLHQGLQQLHINATGLALWFGSFHVIFIYFCYSCISVFPLQHGSLLSIHGRDDLTHSFSAVSDRPSHSGLTTGAFHFLTEDVKLYCLCISMFPSFYICYKCMLLNWEMRYCVRLRNLLELWKSVANSLLVW